MQSEKVGGLGLAVFARKRLADQMEAATYRA